MSQTEIKIVNKMKEDVVIWLTLGATPGCLQDVTQIPWITSGSGLQGSFTLGGGASVSYIPAEGVGLNGNLTAGTPPLNCATDEFSDGINLFEFIINNSFQSGNPQETVDISCVPGVNALWHGDLSGGGQWNAGPNYPDVKNFHNTVLGSNTGLVGVFPFACDNCTASVAPPVCPNPIPLAPNPQSEAICNIQRDASESGGVITATLLGVLATL